MTDSFLGINNENQDQEWMRQALLLANKAKELGEVPVGAVVVCNNQVVGQGWNQPISRHDPSAHAEIIALRDAAIRLGNYRLPDAQLYVTIEPCTMCFGALVHARIKRVVFGAKEPKAGVLCSNTHLLNSDIYNHRFEWQGQVLEEECSAVIQEFFRERRLAQKNK